MSIIQIVCLTAIIGAFIVFAAVLAWGENRTRYIARSIRDERQHGAGFAVLEHTAAAATHENQPQAGPTVAAM